ncbi:DUF317 domain-containing protein [Streptomyces sp. NPDC002446]
MLSTAPHGLEPDTEVLVSPVYLAGPGNSDAVFSILDSAEGWTKTVAFGTDTYYASPCQRVRIANPTESRYGGWTITYAEDPLGVPDWITTFDRRTPHEIVAAFAETLVHSLPNHFKDYFSGGKHHTGTSPEDVLRHHQWQLAHGARPYRTVSPDGLAVHRTRSGWIHEYDELLDPENSTWRLSAGLDPIHYPHWRAFFSSSTPEHLRASAATALTSTDPVLRTASEIPVPHRALVTVRLSNRTASAPRTAAALARSSYAAGPRTARAVPVNPPPPLAAHGRSRRQR